MAARKRWKIGDKEYIQSELMFGAKVEFMGLLFEAGDEALAAGLDFKSLFKIDPKKLQEMGGKELDARALLSLLAASNEEMDVSAFVREFGRLIMRIFGKVPRFLPDAYCVILDIPEEDRDDFKRGPWRKMDDDTGFGIFQLFTQQNGRLLADFGRRWWEQVNGLASSKISESRT